MLTNHPKLHENVVDAKNCFEAKKKLDSAAKIKQAAAENFAALGIQVKLEKWVAEELLRIEELPNKKLNSKALRLKFADAFKDYFKDNNPITDLIRYKADDNSKVREYALAHRDELVKVIKDQLAEMSNLRAKANAKDWPTREWARYTQYPEFLLDLQRQLEYFQKLK
jgi:hypothetical protein